MTALRFVTSVFLAICAFSMMLSAEATEIDCAQGKTEADRSR